MKNQVIVALAQAGFLNVTNNTIENEAYKVVKLRSALAAALQKVENMEQEMLKDCQIGDPNEFNASIKALQGKKKPTADDRKELDNMTAKAEKYRNMQSELMEDEQDLSVSPMSYDTWHKMVLESGLRITAALEDSVKGTLWIEPE